MIARATRRMLTLTAALLSIGAPFLAAPQAIDTGDAPSGAMLLRYDSSTGGGDTVDFGTDELTISAWITTTTGGPILSKAPSRGPWVPGGKVFYVAADGALVFDVGWVGEVRAEVPLTDGLLHHVAMTRDAAGRTMLFVDGKPRAEGVLPGERDAWEHGLWPGECTDDFPVPAVFTGGLEGIRLYGRVLDAAELELLFTDHVTDDPYQEPSAELAAYWTVDHLAWLEVRIPAVVKEAVAEIDYLDATADGTDVRLQPARDAVAALEKAALAELEAARAADKAATEAAGTAAPGEPAPKKDMTERDAAVGRAVGLLAEIAAVETILPLRLPAGPRGEGKFGAFYAKLRYQRAWDERWPVGEHPDVVVRFDRFADRFVFWRGTSFIPCWVNDRDVWFTNEFLERRGGSNDTEGCCEPMSDKQCRFSHVRILESNDARVVVHWRYSPVDVEYRQPFVDEDTGWGDWVDEYYTIYPDGVGVRAATIHSSAPAEWTEWQEAIVLNQPGTSPEDNIETAAVSLANLAGESHTYGWTEDGGPAFDAHPSDACIQVVHLKGERSPFTIVDPDGASITSYRGHAPGHRFHFWNHWPVAQEKSWTTVATTEALPSHTSLSHMEWKDHRTEGDARTKVLLHGMTVGGAGDLVSLARSWLHAPVLLPDGPLTGGAYDRAERAYVLDYDATSERTRSFLLLQATSASPSLDPAFVLRGWGDAPVTLEVGGVEVPRGDSFRYGYRTTETGTDLVVWIELRKAETVMLSLVRGSE